MCWVRWCLRANGFLHIPQIYAFSPVWMTMWYSRLCFRAKALSQREQTNLRLASLPLTTDLPFTYSGASSTSSLFWLLSVFLWFSMRKNDRYSSIPGNSSSFRSKLSFSSAKSRNVVSPSSSLACLMLNPPIPVSLVSVSLSQSSAHKIFASSCVAMSPHSTAFSPISVFYRTPALPWKNIHSSRITRQTKHK